MVDAVAAALTSRRAERRRPGGVVAVGLSPPARPHLVAAASRPRRAVGRRAAASPLCSGVFDLEEHYAHETALVHDVSALGAASRASRLNILPFAGRPYRR